MRPTTATVRLDDIVHNYRLAMRLAPASQCIAVIKANAYGHGMIQVANCLQHVAPAFAVAMLEEAISLREAGIDKPIAILQGINRASDIKVAADNNFWLVLHRQQQLEWLLSANLPRPVGVWIKVDTGMHRLGFAPDQLDRLVEQLTSSANVQPDPVLCTHLACADDRASPMTGEQLSLIRSCTAKFKLAVSIANSAGILFWPDSHADWNRPGYMLYGACPAGAFDTRSHGLRAAMTMQSELVAIRHLKRGDGVGYGQVWVAKRASKIGTVAIGYGDGYPRHAPSGAPVVVNGQRVALVGRVSMDAISVDLTDLESAQVGDPVELWGQKLSVNELASAAGTIGYELLAGLTGRVPTIYQD